MTSDELNKKISALDDVENPIYESFGGKVVPYIGWYWRTVNFNTKDHYFGVLPIIHGIDANDKKRVGFMEKNKWDYDTVYCPPKKWARIKQLLEKAVTDMTVGDFKAVNEEIQSLLPK